MVHWLGRPAVTSDQQIHLMKVLLKKESNVILLKSPVNVHERIKIINILNQRSDYTGTSRPVLIFLNSLGYIITPKITEKALITIGKLNYTSMIDKTSYER